VKHVIPGWLSVIVVSRDCIILVGIAVLAIMSISFQIRPTMISKMTMFFQLLTIFAVLVIHTLAMAAESAVILMGLYVVTSLLTIASGLNYIFKGIGFINNTST
jgi:cardiolipin synthase